MQLQERSVRLERTIARTLTSSWQAPSTPARRLPANFLQIPVQPRGLSCEIKNGTNCIRNKTYTNTVIDIFSASVLEMSCFCRFFVGSSEFIDWSELACSLERPDPRCLLLVVFGS